MSKKVTKKHLMELLSEDIESKGVKVIYNVNSLPIYGEPYTSSHLIVCLNHSGSVILEYDLQTVEFKRHDIAMVQPDHTLTAISSSADYKATLLIISSEFLKELISRVAHMTFFKLHNISKSHLTDQQFESVQAYFKMLESISVINHPARMDMLTEQIDVGTRMCDYFLNENARLEPIQISERQQLLTNFFDAITQHYRESREVKFYANLLCLTPKHFGTIVRQATGIGAGEWIARYVVIQAKKMLRLHPELSIQQVSHKLNFCDQTAFCRYFKNYTRMTPREYRRNY